MLTISLLFDNAYLLANVADACQNFVEEEKQKYSKLLNGYNTILAKNYKSF